MSDAFYVVGFKPPDETWKKMKAVYDSCKKAGIDPPKDVEKFFNYEEPDDKGVEVPLFTSYQSSTKNHPSTKHWDKEGYDGVEISVADIPKDIKILRFYISY